MTKTRQKKSKYGFFMFADGRALRQIGNVFPVSVLVDWWIGESGYAVRRLQDACKHDVTTEWGSDEHVCSKCGKRLD